ncbi:hypothetical protein CHARACLAT_020785 [Characodon lateralis]|uniref:Uncharacterized protein n=1 Tax=Characodon lateralis TaxID=208331 RepID=A0ABU7CPT4_9TELE|nr:hypothetical protein [Characodon lateralis]
MRSREQQTRRDTQTSLSPLGGAHGVARPAERHSSSSVSWAVPWTTSRWDLPGTPQEPPQLAPLDVEV